MHIVCTEERAKTNKLYKSIQDYVHVGIISCLYSNTLFCHCSTGAKTIFDADDDEDLLFK